MRYVLYHDNKINIQVYSLRRSRQTTLSSQEKSRKASDNDQTPMTSRHKSSKKYYYKQLSTFPQLWFGCSPSVFGIYLIMKN